MIKNIIAMLQIDEFIGISDNIEIAKGKYKLHNTVRKAWKQGKRELKLKRNGGN